MTKHNISSAIITGTGLVLLSGLVQAFAQSVDYGSLQALYDEPITTSATGTPQRVSEVPANMTIITADEIRRSGARTIPEILARVPGLDILQSGSTVFDVGVRGYQQPFQPRLLALVDGRQVFLDDYSRTAWENVPVNIDDIRQIEVVKGASSALFGSNAAGGVINIVTYSPIYDNNNVASVRVGTQDSRMADATTTIKGSWGGSKFTAGGMNARDFDTFRYSPDFDQVAADPVHYYASNSSVFQLNHDAQIFTEANYSRSTGNTADPTDWFVMGREDIDTYSFRGGFNWQTSYGLISFDNYYNHSDITLSEPTSGGAPYAFKIGLFDSKLQDQLRVNQSNTLRLGLEYKHKDFSMTGAQLIEFAAPGIAENNIAASASWLAQISDNFSWTNAVRVDYLDMRETGTLMASSFFKDSDYSRNLRTWSYNSDIVYKPTELDSIRAGFGRGVQLPSLINTGYGIFQNFAGTLSDWEGNPYLKPTIVDDYSIDYTRKLPELFSFIKISPYYEVNHDIVSPLLNAGTIDVPGSACSPDCLSGYSVNVGGSKGWGTEIELKGSHPSGFRWDASYSFAYVKDSAGVFNNYVNYQRSAPRHHYRLLLGYTTGAWEFDGFGQYLTSTSMLRSSDGGNTASQMRVGGYSSLGARIGYNINESYTLAISGNNITQDTTGTSPYPKIERQGFITLTSHF